MKPTGIPAMAIELDDDAEKRIAISHLLSERRQLWDRHKPWINDVLHGAAAVDAQSRVVQDLARNRDALLALGYEDQFCHS